MGDCHGAMGFKRVLLAGGDIPAPARPMQLSQSLTSRQKPSTLWFGGLAMLAAALMLGAGLNDFSMWLDEVNMTRAALAWNPLDFATYGLAGHPPLYFILLRGWIGLAGQGDLALRALTLFAGLLATAFVFRVAADFSRGVSGGVIAALLFASMGFVKYYVHETHNYAQFMLLCVALLFFAERWWLRPRRRAYAAGVILSIAALIYTHYYSIYFLAALNVGALIFAWKRWGQWARWVGLEALAGLLYTPWLFRIALIVQKIIEGRANKVRRIPTAQGTSAGTIMDAAAALLSDQVVLYGIALALGVAGLMWLGRARRPDLRRLLPRLALLATLIFGSVALALVVNRFYNTFTPRRVIYVLPVFAILLATLLATLPRWLGWAAALIVTSVAVWYGWSVILPGNWFFRQAVESVRDQLQPGDLVLLQATDAPVVADHSRPLIYYGRTLLPPHIVVMTLGQQSIIGTPDGDEAFANTVFAPAVVTHRRFWVISAIDSTVAPATLDWVSRLKLWAYRPAHTQEIGAMRVTRFERVGIGRGALPDAATLSPRPLMSRVFGDIFELDQAQISRTTVKSGDTIDIWLDWQAIRRPDQDYAVFIHLLSGSGTLMAQTDGDPVDISYPAPTGWWAIFASVFDARTLVVPAGLPAGTYQLRLGIYSRTTEARLPVVPADGTIADSLLLTAIQVVR